MKIELVFITYNRLDYTRRALPSVLADPAEEFSLTIWDNASTDGTVEYLKKEVGDHRIRDIIFSDKNYDQKTAMNHVWTNTNADLIGKLDNDCLATPGWTRVLAKAHQDIGQFGAIACWRLPLDDFDEGAARKAGKIQKFGQHHIFRHPWVCGSGFLMKRETYLKYGPLNENAGVGLTDYFLKMALGGEINGWYYPFILAEHMDDQKSKYTMLTSDKAVKEMRNTTVALRIGNITNMQGMWRRRQRILDNLNKGPWEAKYYVGWRSKLRKIGSMIKGVLDFKGQ